MKVIESIFREYDIRGTYPEEINEGIISIIGQAIALKCKQEGITEISVGRDGRLSGEILLDSMCNSIAKSGIAVSNIGLVTSPILYYAAKKSASKSGIMITGCHNPKDDNGIKMVINDKPVSGTEILSLTKCVPEFDKTKKEINKINIIEDYINDVLQKIILNQPENLKVVVDCGNGAAGCVAPELFKRLGCNVINLFSEIDGNFPNHHPDPGKVENLQDLIEIVKKEEADLGIAFDGDGDRLGVVSNLGEIIYPDQLMMIFSRAVLKNSKRKEIVFDVKCTNLLAEIITEAGGIPIMSPTGHFHIKNTLKKTSAPLAGEMSGHIFFNDQWYGFDDGHYSAFRLIEVIKDSTSSLSTMFDQLPKAYSTPEVNINVDEQKKFKIVKDFVSQSNFGEGEKITIDGLRVNFNDGWGLLRASNTTPKLVLRFEANSPERLNEIQNIFLNQLKKIDETINIELS